MPVLVDVDLRWEVPGRPVVTASGVRSLLGRFAIDPGGRHGDQDKPYRAGELPAGGVGTWRVGWCGPGAEPGWVLGEVLGDRFRPGPVLGVAGLRVVRVRRDEVSFAELWEAKEVSEPAVWFQSPTVFRRATTAVRPNGARRWWLVADPVLVVESLARGWQRWAPQVCRFDRADISEVLDHVVVRWARIDTRTVGDAEPQGRPTGGAAAVVDGQPGFVGGMGLGLARGVSTRGRRVFSALLGFAVFHGVGAQRCYGFGDVEVSADPAREGSP